MSQLMKGKRGLIFGVANKLSIAWGCAERFAAEGASLAFNFLGDAQEKRVRELVGATDWSASGEQPLVLPCDVTSDNDLTQFFQSVKERWSSIDFIVHSVAYTEKDCLRLPFVETSRQNFALTMDVSVYSLLAIVREARPLLTNRSAVVTMSYFGAEKVVPKYNVMGVAKAALESTTRYLAYDLGPQGVRINALSAGPIRTLSSSAIPGIREMLDNAQRFAPLRRNVTQEDISQTALYLVSELSQGVTGEVLHVDCGYNTLGMFEVLP
jgi:enoyl-[acyl-carrier protein] reductase I